MNKDLLKGHIRSCGMTQRDVAEKMGISLSRFNAKVNATGGAEFLLGEVQELKKILALSPAQIDLIFLS